MTQASAHTLLNEVEAELCDIILFFAFVSHERSSSLLDEDIVPLHFRGVDSTKEIIEGTRESCHVPCTTNVALNALSTV